MRLSLNMVACNEEPHMRAALSDIRPYVDEIVVVVQQSNDRTLELARELADVVIEHPCYGYCEPSRPAAVAASSGDWILALDADERLSTYGKDNIRAWVAGVPSFYLLRRLTLIDGTPLEDAPHGRLFSKSSVFVPTVIHTCYEARGATRLIAEQVVIEHFKTAAEQRYDDLRYIPLMK